MSSRKTYEELSKLKTYEERVNYLKCTSVIGVQTFGKARYLNQVLYQQSPEWAEVKERAILRDNGCDLGIEDRPVSGSRNGVVHHINPITVEQVLNRDPCVFDLNNLIFCSSRTHRMIHFGTDDPKSRDPIERQPNDTCPWRIKV